MRTIPAAISTGLSSGYRMFYLVKIEGTVSSEGDTIHYWTTADKNNDGNALTLKETSGGGSLTYDSGMIAKRVDGWERNGIGQIDAGMEIGFGGGTSYISDVGIEILNQERFDETIVSTAVKLENRAITIYLGFVPGGASPAVAIQTDMIKLYTGIIDSVNDYDFSDFSIKCVDGAFRRHREIPTTEINRTNYPNAPKDNIGRPVPILYGAFFTSGTQVDEELEVEQWSGGAPAIRYHDQENKYILADHALHTLERASVHVQNNLFGVLTTPTAISAANATYTWDDTSTTVSIAARIWQQPKKRGALMASGYSSHASAVDASITTGVGGLVDNTTSIWYLALDNPVNIGLLSSAGGAFKVRFGDIAVGGTIRLRVYDGAAYENGADLTSADSNTTKEMNFTGMTKLEDFSTRQFGIEGNTSGTFNAKNVYVEYYVYPVSFGRQMSLRMNLQNIPQVPTYKLRIKIPILY